MPMSAPSATKQSSITVAVRVRPFTEQEENKLVREPTTPVFYDDGRFSSGRKDENGPKTAKNVPAGLRKIVNVVDDKMLIFDPPESNPLNTMQRQAFPNGQFRGRIRDYKFVFDNLFDEKSTQQEVYSQTTKPLLDSVLDGYNATVFAYGATGCGKTHTISGSPENPGVIFLTMEEMYRKIGLLSDTRVFDVSVSFLEIYNETIRDLLAPETPSKRLTLREDSAKRIVVSSLSTHKPSTVDDVMNLLILGNQNRTSSPTEANAASSRSHAVLQIHVASHSRTANLTEEHTYATLSIIDLAGSERAAATKNRGARLNEGANINKSLLALGNCINALCDPGRRCHVPYRDSKLTRLLKFSLGGNCKTVMIVCISPSSQHYDETLNTLKYANRAKEIKTKVLRNRQNLDRHVGSYLKMITEQRLEIEELRSREAAAIRASLATSEANAAMCLRAILDSVSSLKATLARSHHDKWRKCFSLAKRKLLLLHVRDLDLVMSHVQGNLGSTISHPVRRFLNHAQQLQEKFNEQIVNLEHFYDTRTEIDDILHGSVGHSLKKFQEMDGWTAELTDIYQSMVGELDGRLQHDLLANSSVLFDFLVDQMGEFCFLTGVLCDCIDSSLTYRNGGERSGNYFDNVLEKATAVIERMCDSDYDIALEEATAAFISDRSGQPDIKTEDMCDSPTSLNRQKDKRASTPPRNFPPTKRSMSTRKSAPTSMVEESDLSIDDSAFLGKSDLDDSPISNVNRSMLDFDAVDCQVLDSPPMKTGPSLLRGSSGSRSSSIYAEPKIQPIHHGKQPLLNKRASTKVTNAGEPLSGVVTSSDLLLQPDSSTMDSA